MTLDQISAISQLVAAVGVIASLVFVGLQIRGSAKAVRSATTQAVHEHFGRLYFELAQNPQALQTYIKGCTDASTLTTTEKEQFTCFAMGVLAFYQNAFDQWRVDHLRADLWSGWETLLTNFLHTPGGASLWRERGYAFGKDFQAHVTKIMSRPRNPLATTFGIDIAHK